MTMYENVQLDAICILPVLSSLHTMCSVTIAGYSVAIHVLTCLM